MASFDLGSATAGGYDAPGPSADHVVSRAAPAARSPAAHPPAGVSLDQIFDAADLYALRAAVAAHASDLGLPAERVGDLVMIAHELASNVIRHGRTAGRLRLWRENDTLRCQVSDTGPGLADPEAGREPAPITAVDGRGLWIVRQLSDDLAIESGPDGATLTATIGLPHAVS